MMRVQRMKVQLFTAGGAQKRAHGRGGIELGFEDLCRNRERRREQCGQRPGAGE